VENLQGFFWIVLGYGQVFSTTLKDMSICPSSMVNCRTSTSCWN